MLRLMSAGPSTTFTLRQIFERNARSIGRADLQFANIFHAVAQILRQPDDAGKSALSFINLGCGFARDRGLDHVVYVRRIQAVAGDGAAVDVDGEVLLAADAVDTGVLRALDAGRYFCNLISLFHQHIQIVSVEHHCDIGADTGDHLVHAVADGLRHDQVDPGQSREPFADLLGNAVLGHAMRPLVIRSERGEHVGLVGTRRIGRGFAAAQTGDHIVDPGYLQHQALHLLLHLQRFLERDVRHAIGVG